MPSSTHVSPRATPLPLSPPSPQLSQQVPPLNSLSQFPPLPPSPSGRSANVLPPPRADLSDQPRAHVASSASVASATLQLQPPTLHALHLPVQSSEAAVVPLSVLSNTRAASVASTPRPVSPLNPEVVRRVGQALRRVMHNTPLREQAAARLKVSKLAQPTPQFTPTATPLPPAMRHTSCFTAPVFQATPHDLSSQFSATPAPPSRALVSGNSASSLSPYTQALHELGELPEEEEKHAEPPGDAQPQLSTADRKNFVPPLVQSQTLPLSIASSDPSMPQTFHALMGSVQQLRDEQTRLRDERAETERLLEIERAERVRERAEQLQTTNALTALRMELSLERQRATEQRERARAEVEAAEEEARVRAFGMDHYQVQSELERERATQAEAEIQHLREQAAASMQPARDTVPATELEAQVAHTTRLQEQLDEQAQSLAAMDHALRVAQTIQRDNTPAHTSLVPVASVFDGVRPPTATTVPTPSPYAYRPYERNTPLPAPAFPNSSPQRDVPPTPVASTSDSPLMAVMVEVLNKLATNQDTRERHTSGRSSYGLHRSLPRPADFVGKSHEELSQWFLQTEARIGHMDDEDRIKLARSLLQGNDCNYPLLSLVEDLFAQLEAGEVVTWTTFRRQLERGAAAPFPEMLDKLKEHCQKDKEKVMDYASRFQLTVRMMHWAWPEQELTEPVKVDYFVKNLLPHLRDEARTALRSATHTLQSICAYVQTREREMMHERDSDKLKAGRVLDGWMLRLPDSVATATSSTATAAVSRGQKVHTITAPVAPDTKALNSVIIDLQSQVQRLEDEAESKEQERENMQSVNAFRQVAPNRTNAGAAYSTPPPLRGFQPARTSMRYTQFAPSGANASAATFPNNTPLGSRVVTPYGSTTGLNPKREGLLSGPMPPGHTTLFRGTPPGGPDRPVQGDPSDPQQYGAARICYNCAQLLANLEPGHNRNSCKRAGNPTLYPQDQVPYHCLLSFERAHRDAQSGPANNRPNRAGGQ